MFQNYNRSLYQIILVGLVCFCCPGMFNALQGMGGGGQVDHTVVDRANAALYACFSIFGFFSGGINNLLGPRLTLLIGTLGYVLYAGSLLCYNITSNGGFVVASGAILGVCAGMLWAAQGAMMMSYPDERNKGRYISIFWAIFNIGGVIGGIIPLIINLRQTSAGSVSNETYIAFIVVMALGGMLTLTLLPPHKVVRDDGSMVAVVKYPDWKAETIAILKLLTNWKLLVLIPMCFSSNFFYTYQFNAVNGFYFNVRTRSLNNVIYWGMQILGAALFGMFLDSPRWSRRTRGYLGLAIVCLVLLPTWAGGVAFQVTYERNQPSPAVDWTDRRFGGAFVLYALYGLNDALWQVFCYWVLGSLTSDSQMLSRFAGFYKSFQSAGAAIAWSIDGHGVNYLTQIIINFVLLVVSLPVALFVIASITESNGKDSELAMEKVDKLEHKKTAASEHTLSPPS
ncbi:uncharacterized protein VTP21DRAFT_2952 [Calcarisporiella thermophila]|uniref:uncharacterized protein n=1 Tax=Calcarisporiella thermophila TaxID=911321 RepID=UPI00374280F5